MSDKKPVIAAERWLMASELMGLPEMPETRSGVIRKAKNEGWDSRKRIKGKGLEYSLSSLPAKTMAHILSKEAGVATRKAQAKKAQETGDKGELWEAFERMCPASQEEGLRRAKIMIALEELEASGMSREAGIRELTAEHGDSRATIYRWHKASRKYDRGDWAAILAPGWGRRAGKTYANCAPEAWEFFKSMYLAPERRTMASCYEFTKRTAQEMGWAIPSCKTFERWVEKRIPRITRVIAREGENAVGNMYPVQERTVHQLHALEWLNGDGYQHNVFVKMDVNDPNEKPWRPKTWFWQDVKTRMMVGWRTDRTEHTDMIRLALGDVLDKYGIPKHITIDNTRAAANKWLTGGVKNRYRFKVREDDPLGIIPSLGVSLHWTTVNEGKGHGQAKPVERAFGIGGVGDYIDRHPKFAGAWTGPNPMAKPDNYGERVISFEEFVAVMEAEIHAWNIREKRRTEMCAGMYSFAQVFNKDYEANAHRIPKPAPAQRRLLMLTAEQVTVQRDATINLSISAGPGGRNRYGADELIEFVGKKVAVRFDPADMHGKVYVYDNSNRYICEADCIEAAGFGDTTKGREWRKLRTQRLKNAKEQLAAHRRMTALEASAYMPETPPAPEPKTNVSRGVFQDKPQQKVVGSDLDDDHQLPEEHQERFNNVRKIWEAELKRTGGMKLGGRDDD